MNKAIATTAGVLLFVLAAASCKTGPDYQRPELDMPASFKSASEDELAQPGLSQEWWRLFQDPELDALVEEALVANQDVKAAMARVEQSRASAASVKGSFFPVITSGFSASRSRTPGASTSSDSSDKLSEAITTVEKMSSIVDQISALAEGDTSGTGTTSSTGTSTSLTSSSSEDGASKPSFSSGFQVPFDLSYEIDMWGRIRRSYESAQAQRMASAYDLELVRQTLLADLVKNYFNIRSLDSQVEIINKNLALYQEQADLTQWQYQSGLESETDALQARIQLESTRAQAADTNRQRTDLEHAIAILLGRAPSQFSLAARPLTTTPPTIPAGLPSDLLRRRPDVAEAEQNLVAACAEIGVAQADFFPTIKLTGSAGFQSSDIGEVLDWQNRYWSLGPSISLPIFKGGQLKASLQQAKARYDELEATYRTSVLGAFLDVEDSLTDLHQRAIQAESQTKASEAAREYLRLTQIEYKTGTSDYMQVVNAEQTVLSNELSDVDILYQRIASTILLIKAIGGGWEA